MSDSEDTSSDRSKSDSAGQQGEIVLALHVHIPRIPGRYRCLDQQADYFDAYRTRDLCTRYVQECVLPTNRILHLAIQRHEGRFKVSISISGIALDLFEKHAPEAIDSFQQLVRTGNVELLGTPYHQGLAFAYSLQAFTTEATRHRDRVVELFDQEPRVFRNTELICSEQVANTVAHLGCDGLLCDAPHEALAGRSWHRPYACGHSEIPVLMRDPELSTDVSDYFSGGVEGKSPLVAPQFAKRLVKQSGNGLVGLFLDYEVFGRRFVTDSGIFEFLRHLPDQVIEQGGEFRTASQALKENPVAGELHLGRHVSPSEWGGTLSPWLGGSMQSHAAHQLYAMESQAAASDDDRLLNDWQCLQGAEYLLAMSMLDRAAERSKHLIPHLDGPYHAYIVFMNILDDVARRMEMARSVQRRTKATATSE